MASYTLEQDHSPHALRASPCAAASKYSHLADQEGSTNLQTRASHSTSTGPSCNSRRSWEPQGLPENASKLVVQFQDAGSTYAPLGKAPASHKKEVLQFQTAAQWLGQEAKDAKESRELRLKTHRVRAYQGDAIQKENLDQTLTQETLTKAPAPNRPRYDPYELDCPLFRLYAEEPHMFTGIDYFED